MNQTHEEFSSPSKRLKRRQNLSKRFHLVRSSGSISQFLKGLTFGTFVALFLITVLSLDEYQQREKGLNDTFRELNEKQEETKGSISPVVDTNVKESEFKLDFLMAGFPKTGSTSFLHLFQNHIETNVFEREVCGFTSDEQIAQLSELLKTIPTRSSTISQGIKCPIAMWNSKGLSRLHEIKSDLKIIIGVRHPVSWFQSFYNYRVTEMHDKGKVVVPPSPQTLIWPKIWKGVGTGGSRFDIALMQLGKIELGAKDLMLLGERGRRVFPSSFKVFLYDIDQLSDKNEERSRVFRKDLQEFLGLKHEIGEIPVSNKNHFTRENRHPETINICSPEYNKLRKELVKNGNVSKKWIQSKFVGHQDVTVGGQQHFFDVLDKWSNDPCLDILSASKK